MDGQALAGLSVAEQNDMFRRDLTVGAIGGSIVFTPEVLALDPVTRLELVRQVCEFSTFSEDNDPYGEHDFGKVEIVGRDWFWKIDYYDLERQFHSPDKANPDVTHRVLTIMEASEY